jgi:hypothetical protein
MALSPSRHKEEEDEVDKAKPGADKAIAPQKRITTSANFVFMGHPPFKKYPRLLIIIMPSFLSRERIRGKHKIKSEIIIFSQVDFQTGKGHPDCPEHRV